MLSITFVQSNLRSQSSPKKHFMCGYCCEGLNLHHVLVGVWKWVTVALVIIFLILFNYLFIYFCINGEGSSSACFK